jgi:uncharacterized protein (TIGR02453 family)
LWLYLLGELAQLARASRWHREGRGFDSPILHTFSLKLFKMDANYILDFLKQLQANNNKAWMDAHKPAYQQARTELINIADYLIKGTASFDQAITTLEPKNCIFRINRDIRFSKDKTPYKSNMGLYLSKGGRNSGYAGYYLHLEPQDRSFIAGGLYQPETEALQKIRQEIDYNADTVDRILSEPRFKKLFGSLQGDQLQRPPKGYQADHPHIEWIKLKSFTVIHPVKDSQVTKQGFLEHVLTTFQAIEPLIRFLNTALQEEE